MKLTNAYCCNAAPAPAPLAEPDWAAAPPPAGQSGAQPAAAAPAANAAPPPLAEPDWGAAFTPPVRSVRDVPGVPAVRPDRSIRDVLEARGQPVPRADRNVAQAVAADAARRAAQPAGTPAPLAEPDWTW